MFSGSSYKTDICIDLLRRMLQIVCELTDKLDELSKKEEELKKYGHG